ncbi:hypothetical protein ACWGPT_18465 [Pseudorhizobium sp. NPDC055634]
MSEDADLDQELPFDEEFEERADHVEEDVLRDGTATSDHFDEVVRDLLGRGLVLLVGPRGCGKTHLMRYAWLTAIGDPTKPFCVYTTLNRYLSLEPLSTSRRDVNALFHTWVLARILEAASEALQRINGQSFDLAGALQLERADLKKLLSTLERNFPLDEDDEHLHRALSIQVVQAILRSMAEASGRKRIVLLLDDAALTLSPAFLTEFLDLLRVVKAPDIAPKCSVYPGTTVYGSRFHADHEGKFVSAWISAYGANYRSMMQTIAERRYPDGLQGISPDANSLLQYAAFGVPRAYLTLLRNVRANKSVTQAVLTRVIRAHHDNRISEFRSLGDKVVELRTLVRAGETFFQKAVEGLRDWNDANADSNTKQAVIGINDDELNPLSERMIDLLTEAGLLYPATEVSHGKGRRYRRYEPHLASLIAERAFSGSRRGTSAAQVVEFIERPSQKHPLRRSPKTILGKDGFGGLKLDLPPCQNCQTPRDNERQRFCHQCGTRLVEELTYNRIMSFEIADVPSLSTFQKGTLRNSSLKTVGDLRALRDPGSELRKLPRIGQSYSNKILDRIEAYVDEMMS